VGVAILCDRSRPLQASPTSLSYPRPHTFDRSVGEGNACDWHQKLRLQDSPEKSLEPQRLGCNRGMPAIGPLRPAFIAAFDRCLAGGGRIQHSR